MNDIGNWFQNYFDHPVVMQIGTPVLYVMVVGLLAFLLWAASRIARQEHFTFLHAFRLAAIEAVVMTGLAWGLLSVLGGASVQSLALPETQLPFHGIFWILNLGLVVGLLLALDRMSIQSALFTWAGHFILVALVSCLAVGITCM